MCMIPEITRRSSTRCAPRRHRCSSGSIAAHAVSSSSKNACSSNALLTSLELAIHPRRQTLLSTNLVGVAVTKHPSRLHQYLDVEPEAPVGDVFEIGVQPVCQVLLAFGRSAEPSDLRQPGDAGLEHVAMPVAAVDLPIE